MKVALSEGDQQGIPFALPAMQRLARIERGGHPAVDDQVGRLTGDRCDRDLVLGVEHQRSVEQHVGRHRGENLNPGSGRHDGPARRQVVRRRAGGRGHDQRIGREGQKRLVVDQHLRPHRMAAGGALQDQVVEGAAVEHGPAGVAEVVGHGHVQSHPGLDPVVAGQESAEGLAQGFRLDGGQVTEMAEVDAEHRHPHPTDQIHGAQHGAVPAQADGEVEVVRPLAVAGSGAVGIEEGRHMPFPPQPAPQSPAPTRRHPPAGRGSTNPIAAMLRPRIGPSAAATAASISREGSAGSSATNPTRK